MNNAEKRQNAAALLAILNEADEQDWLEAKSLRDDTSRSILETVCSLSNDNQRTALVFLREVGAIDAVAYRQLTGCKPKLVAKELAGIKDQGLMIQKGRARGTYYIPSGSLEESIEDEKRKRRSQSQAVTSTPQAVTGTPQAVTGTPQTVTGAPPNENITSLPEALLKELGKLKQRTPPQKMKDLVLRLCEVRPMTRDDLMFYLKRGSTTIDNYIALMLGKELDYLYPMMIHHPRQAYVPLGFHHHHEGTAT
jgi:ATP-dependent DNA helicase RecG